MGKRVTVKKEYYRRYWGSNRVYEIWPYTKEWQGWIVGFRTIQNGVVETNAYGEHEEYLEEHFVPNEYIPCALVTKSPHNNPIKVPLDGFEVINE